jgi:hypothetical protein
MPTHLVLNALRIALATRQPGADFTPVHHTDQGSQGSTSARTTPSSSTTRACSRPSGRSETHMTIALRALGRRSSAPAGRADSAHHRSQGGPAWSAGGGRPHADRRARRYAPTTSSWSSIRAHTRSSINRCGTEYCAPPMLISDCQLTLRVCPSLHHFLRSLQDRPPSRTSTATRGRVPTPQDRTAGRKMAAHGEKPWPPVGRFSGRLW